MHLGDVPVSPDTTPGAWLAAALGPTGSGVGSLVPAALPAHARVFHPAAAYLGDDDLDVPWQEVAAANGTVAHPLMQWPALTGGWEYIDGDSQPPTWDGPPPEGHLPAQVAEVLAALLGTHTATPGQCWFARWEGFGYDAPALRAAPRLHLPGRAYLLAAGTVGDAGRNLAPEPHEQGANLWWPADRAWVVATDIDLMSTYVAGSRECIAALLASDALEAHPAHPADPVGFDADTVNALPARRR